MIGISRFLQPGLVLILAALLSPVSAEELKIFDLKGATPQELIPLIQPFVGPEGTVTGMHNQLIVRTSAERMAEVVRLVQTLDRAPRRLLIHVRDSAPERTVGSRIDLSVDTPRVEIGDAEGNRLRLKHYTTETRDQSEHTLQTLEGRPTLIASGVSLPVVTQQGYVGGPRGGYQTSYGYRDVDSGFYATVHLVGDRVRIEITTAKQAPIAGSAAISRQTTDSVVSGALGEWLPLAGLRQQRGIERTGIASRADSESASASELWVKVERLPD